MTRLALGLVYSLIMPVWESYDEDGHFAYARYLAKYRQLLQPGDPEAEAVWEKFQPPLYYIAVAPAIAWLDLGETFVVPERNPYFIHGNAGVNYALHPAQPQGAAYEIHLAVRIGRALGVLISTASVFFVFLAARRLWPTEPRTAWTATMVYAFWPQYLFIGSMLSNDVLVTALGAVVFYLALAAASDRFRLRHILVLAAALGAALLTKLNAIAFIPMALAAAGLSLISGAGGPIRWRSPRLWLALLGAVVITAGALRLVGSLDFVTAQVFQAETVRDFLRYAPAEGTVPDFVTAGLRYGFRTFLASYGWGNLEAYGWLYWLWTLGAGLGAAGLIIGAARRRRRERRRRLFGLMGLQVVSLVGLAVALAVARQDVYLVPGRYLLPALPAASLLLVGGWRALLRRRHRARAWQAISAGLLLVSWSIPFVILAPAYAKPKPLPADAVLEHRLRIKFGDEIELIGYPTLPTAVPGGDYQLTLCWQAVAAVSGNYSVFVEIIGPDGQGYGRLETYPGRGNYATSLWEVNRPFCDRYALPVGPDIPAPSAAAVRVKLLDGVGGVSLPIQANGEAWPEPGVSVPIRVSALSRVPAVPFRAEYRFGQLMQLRGYDLQPLPGAGRGIQVTLWWEALANLPEDYVVFVHLRDSSEEAYAQSDVQPRQGWYPTSFWRRGDIVVDVHSLVFPAAAATSPLDLYVGLYHAESEIRLPVFDGRGQPVQNDEVWLLTLP